MYQQFTSFILIVILVPSASLSSRSCLALYSVLPAVFLLLFLFSCVCVSCFLFFSWHGCSALSLVLRLLSVIPRPGETVCSVSMSLADVSGSELSGPSSALIRSSVKLDDLSGDFSVLVSCPSRLQGLFLLLFLLLRAGCSIECSRSIASALHSMSFISLESRWSVFLILYEH